jgi:peptidoglycan/LPS O-acetylase OafA/YrhL
MPGREMRAMVKNILLVVAVALLALFLFFSNGHYLHNSKIYAQIYYLNFAIGAGVVILILASTGENILTKLFSSSFLSSLGIVSYSFYLFHPLVIQFVKHAGGSLVSNGGVRFVMVSLISYILACLLYYFIERPLLGMVEKRSK